MRFDKDLVAASATLLVLGILSEGESYGYAILKRVQEVSDGRMTWTDGMLYPLLHRLERQGYVEGLWAVAENGRRRRHYTITPVGRDALAERHQQWAVVSETLAGLQRAASLPAQRLLAQRLPAQRLRVQRLRLQGLPLVVWAT